MGNIVYVRTYKDIEVNKNEIFRYAGMKEATFEIETALEECLKEALVHITYKVCFSEFDINFCENSIDLGFCQTNSKDLIKNLQNCRSIILFGATVGINIDRLIAKYGAVSPTKALLFQAIGAERIESLANTFNKEITKEKGLLGKYTKPRFSPGYGDLPIETQKDIFAAIDCHRKIGLTLNESLLMSPTKSVTGIIGISDEKGDTNTKHNCSLCDKKDCSYRRNI